jgi:hypothetical protein
MLSGIRVSPVKIKNNTTMKTPERRAAELRLTECTPKYIRLSVIKCLVTNVERNENTFITELRIPPYLIRYSMEVSFAYVGLGRYFTKNLLVSGCRRDTLFWSQALAQPIFWDPIASSRFPLA